MWRHRPFTCLMSILTTCLGLGPVLPGFCAGADSPQEKTSGKAEIGRPPENPDGRPVDLAELLRRESVAGVNLDLRLVLLRPSEKLGLKVPDDRNLSQAVDRLASIQKEGILGWLRVSDDPTEADLSFIRGDSGRPELVIRPSALVPRTLVPDVERALLGQFPRLVDLPMDDPDALFGALAVATSQLHFWRGIMHCSTAKDGVCLSISNESGPGIEPSQVVNVVPGKTASVKVRIDETQSRTVYCLGFDSDAGKWVVPEFDWKRVPPGATDTLGRVQFDQSPCIRYAILIDWPQGSILDQLQSRDLVLIKSVPFPVLKREIPAVEAVRFHGVLLARFARGIDTHQPEQQTIQGLSAFGSEEDRPCQCPRWGRRGGCGQTCNSRVVYAHAAHRG